MNISPKTLIVVRDYKHAENMRYDLRLAAKDTDIFHDPMRPPLGRRYDIIIFYGPWFNHPRASYIKDAALCAAAEGCAVIGLT